MQTNNLTREKEDAIILAVLRLRYWGTKGWRPQLSRISDEKRRELLQLGFMVHKAVEQEATA